MNKHTVSAKWLDNMAFESEMDGHKIVMDAHPDSGGDDKGPRPKKFMLTALAGCTGIDVVMILRKMRVELEDLNVSVEAELSEGTPKYYTKMHVIYEFKGKDLPLAKLEKAVKLSEESYCGVSAVYRHSMTMSTEIRIVD